MLKNLTFSAMGALHLESDGDEDTYNAIGKEVCARCGPNLESTLNGAFHHFRETPSTERFAVLHAMMVAYQYQRDTRTKPFISSDEEFRTKAAQNMMRAMVDEKKRGNT